jgi:pepF/M3 family oligoendopeptidase
MENSMTNSTPPRWDLTNVYASLDAPEFQADLAKITHQLDKLESHIAERMAVLDAESAPADLAKAISGFIDQVNVLMDTAGTVRAYIHSFVATDSYNQQARKLLSQFELVGVRMRQLQVQVDAWIGKIAPTLPQVLQQSGSAQEHAFYLKETAEQSKYMMSEAEESLAAELSVSGGSAWGKLQGTVTSQLSVDFELDGQVQKLPMPALINLHSHPDEATRRRAYEAEMVAWEGIKEPLASAMNGIKGTVNTLNRRRGRTDALHSSIDDARIDRATLEAMLEAMHDSFPMFRRYFKAKAARMGKEKLAWWDVFAPVGQSRRSYTFEEAQAFILEHFGKFSPELAGMAERAFENHWIDAEQRVGKRGGAFCMSVPGVQESRILCNFDGSLDQVSTIAHELGHAFHNYAMYKAGKKPLQRDTPMTMAETASIMCETIIVDAALAQAADKAEELAILETALIGDSQVIVDIYSRYLFEKEVFERREKSELSADEFSEIMERAQKATYGEGVDEQYLHKFMWTWKPHYYSTGLSFYNYPYAFGLLFGTGLYAIYLKRGADFVPDYINLLSSTGEGRAAELAARFGIDIRQKAFWQDSLNAIGRRIERYAAL